MGKGMQFKPGPGRTYLYGLYGTLIALASGLMLYVEQRSYSPEVYAACLGAVWTLVRLLKEKRADHSNDRSTE